MKKTLLFLFCTVWLCACTLQETYEGNVLTSRSVGLGLSSAPTCGETPRTVRTTTLGVHVGSDQAALGYISSDLVCIPPECRAVFLVENAEEVERIRALTGDLESICVQPN